MQMYSKYNWRSADKNGENLCQTDFWAKPTKIRQMECFPCYFTICRSTIREVSIMHKKMPKEISKINK